MDRQKRTYGAKQEIDNARSQFKDKDKSPANEKKTKGEKDPHAGRSGGKPATPGKE